jgi:bifunctional non-homologous end joining protein LigD
LKEVSLALGRKTVRLTNLEKVLWPRTGATKRDLLQYYVDVAPALFPHLCDRAMVLKRYSNGAEGDFLFMKRAPASRPEWIETCHIEHSPGKFFDFPIVEDLASLLWVVNLGCIDLNQWYATCDDVHRPDYLHFNLDPTPGASFAQVCEAALLVGEALDELEISAYPKTTGSRGLHIYVPIVRGPQQEDVWKFTGAIAKALESRHRNLITAEHRISRRPPARVLVDYDQNAWGRTLASVYSARPTPLAAVSTPVTWEEIERGIEIENFRIDNVPARLRALGDLWKPLLAQRGRFHLDRLLG